MVVSDAFWGLVAAIAADLRYVSRVAMAEVIAVGEGLKMALELGYSSIYIEGDAQAIITISMGLRMRLKVANGRFGLAKTGCWLNVGQM